MNNRNLTILLLILFSFSYSQKALKIDYYQENENLNLFAFIGEKISIEEFDPNVIKEKKIEIDPENGDTIIRKSFIMDRAFKLKYKVIRNLYNDLKVDTIEFVAYDHYGEPSFATLKNVILYISKSEDKSFYYHRKYEFNEIQKTKKNEWIGLLNFGSVYRIEEGLKLNLKKINLKKSANINLKNIPKQNIELFFPKPFYKIKDDEAIPVLGISIKDLINYKVENLIIENKLKKKE